MTNLSPAGRAKLQTLEGVRLNAYLDSANVWTIGVGHTGKVGGKTVRKGMSITPAQADQLFQQDIDKFTVGLNRLIKVPVPQSLRDALIMWAFNIGLGAAAGSSAMRLVNKTTNFTPAALAKIGKAMSLYNKVTIGGKLRVSKGLISRRKQEVQWLMNGAKEPVGKKVAGGIAGAGAAVGGTATVVDQAPDGTLQSIVDSSSMFGMSGSTILAAIGSIIVVGVLGYIIYKKFNKVD